MNRKMKCMIVDDEPLAADLIKGYIAQVPQLELVAVCRNGVEAFQKIQMEPIDLIFLDIEMPQLTGIELLKSISVRPKVIFTTAYREYAIESYELDVIDYLLKPISLPRFLKAVNRVITQTNDGTPSIIPGMAKSDGYMYVYSDKKNIKVHFRDILYIESLKDYIRLFTQSENIVSKDTIKRYVESLPDYFIRIHRSFIVNQRQITAFTQHDVMIGTKEIPIGVSYKKQVIEQLHKG